jgi:hypothetical protein
LRLNESSQENSGQLNHQSNGQHQDSIRDELEAVLKILSR